VMAPSTLGTFLRSFTFGHVRQLDRVAEAVMGRAWAAGTGPGDGPMMIDLDSTVCEVHGPHKQGAADGYPRVLGYHPLVATRADTGEVLHARQRTGRVASGRGAERFVNETAGPQALQHPQPLPPGARPPEAALQRRCHPRTGAASAR
jgi:Transposase DDE domain group 1